MATLSLPVVFARQEPRKVPPHEDPDPRVVEALKPKRPRRISCKCLRMGFGVS